MLKVIIFENGRFEQKRLHFLGEQINNWDMKSQQLKVIYILHIYILGF